MKDKEELDVTSPEDITVDVRDLKENVPQGYGVYLHGNYWLETESGWDESEPLDRQELGRLDGGARFGKSALMFDSIKNPNKHVMLRGSALALAAVNGEAMQASKFRCSS